MYVGKAILGIARATSLSVVRESPRGRRPWRSGRSRRGRRWPSRRGGAAVPDLSRGWGDRD
eukprot:9002618-Pyramimonas_sp.AAC.1